MEQELIFEENFDVALLDLICFLNAHFLALPGTLKRKLAKQAHFIQHAKSQIFTCYQGLNLVTTQPIFRLDSRACFALSKESNIVLIVCNPFQAESEVSLHSRAFPDLLSTILVL